MPAASSEPEKRRRRDGNQCRAIDEKYERLSLRVVSNARMALPLIASGDLEDAAWWQSASVED